MPKIISLRRAGELLINENGYVKSQTFPQCKSFKSYIREFFKLNNLKGDVSIIILERSLAEQMELNQHLNSCA